MIIICKPEATDQQITHIEDAIRSWGLKTHTSRGVQRTIIGIIGPEDLVREKGTQHLTSEVLGSSGS